MKPALPKGTRDFNAEQVFKRNYLFDTIRSTFIKYGYQPIETPVMENLSTLMGKYGEEGDRLLFKVLNNGDYLAEADEAALAARDARKLLPSIAKRGLRYDLTVPFARFVAMRQSELTFPFKRYQIQPVWRADRPQKGRYNEFYQCDADVVGSNSLLYEAELVQIYDEVFRRLNLPVEIRYNNRKILAGIAEVAGIPDRLIEMTVAIDKLDKVGEDGVQKEMAERGIPSGAIAIISEILAVENPESLRSLFVNSIIGLQGIAELGQVQRYLGAAQLHNLVRFDVTLARGLGYYTGCIFEVKAIGVEMGSIGGGGRYDDLTGVFDFPGMSGVGISFGADRIFDVLEELELFPSDAVNHLKVLVIAFDEATHFFAFQQLRLLRAAGINAELYPEPVKLKKQMKYANDRKAAYTLLIGTDEMASGQLTLKEMTSGAQQALTLSEIIAQLA